MGQPVVIDEIFEVDGRGTIFSVSSNKNPGVEFHRGLRITVGGADYVVRGVECVSDPFGGAKNRVFGLIVVPVTPVDIVLIGNAETLAESVHDGVYRKWITPRELYIEHCRRSALKALNLKLPDPLPSLGAATMFLHDSLEDPNKDGEYLSYNVLVEHTNYYVGQFVKALTNPSKGLNIPREQRKKMDRENVAGLKPILKLWKMLDRTDNLNQMGEAPLDFRRLYLKESELLLTAIGRVDLPDYQDLCFDYKEALARVRLSLP